MCRQLVVSVYLAVRFVLLIGGLVLSDKPFTGFLRLLLCRLQSLCPPPFFPGNVIDFARAESVWAVNLKPDRLGQVGLEPTTYGL